MITEAVHQETAAPAAIVEIARSAHTVTAADGVRIAFDLYQQSGRDKKSSNDPCNHGLVPLLVFNRLAIGGGVLRFDRFRS